MESRKEKFIQDLGIEPELFDNTVTKVYELLDLFEGHKWTDIIAQASKLSDNNICLVLIGLCLGRAMQCEFCNEEDVEETDPKLN